MSIFRARKEPITEGDMVRLKGELEHSASLQHAKIMAGWEQTCNQLLIANKQIAALRSQLATMRSERDYPCGASTHFWLGSE